MRYECSKCKAGKGEQALGESCNTNCGGKVVAIDETKTVTQEWIDAISDRHALSHSLRRVVEFNRATVIAMRRHAPFYDEMIELIIAATNPEIAFNNSIYPEPPNYIEPLT